MIRKVTNGYLTVGILTGVVAMTAWADVAPMAGELEMAGIQKSLQSPVFLSFWLLWGGLVVTPLSLFYLRGFLRVMIAGLATLVLIIGFITGAKNYDYCGKCGTKLERWYDMGRHSGCPKCSPEVKQRHLPAVLRKAAFQPLSDPAKARKSFHGTRTEKNSQVSSETVQHEL